jgi:phage terminase small subunit
MPALTNIRRERFVRHYLKTGIASQAYKAAGYKVSTRNSMDVCASQLLRKPKVASRIGELRRQMTYRTRITLESLLQELAQDRELARREKQASAAIQATVVQAKLVGLMVDRKESGAPGDFSGLTTVDEIVAKAKTELGDDAAAMLLAVLSKTELAEPAMPEPESGALN